MERLFYSVSEKTAFYVSGYDITTNNVEQIVGYLNNNLIIASKLFNCEKENIDTMVVDKSRRYKNMRVFYAKVDMPKHSFQISGDWTMDEWLSN